MISISLTKIATAKPIALLPNCFRANTTKIIQIQGRVKEDGKKSNADASSKSTLIKELYKELWKMLR